MSRLVEHLYSKGVSRDSIEKLLSGGIVYDETDAFTILVEAKRLGAKVLFEDEVGGLDSEPYYAVILEYGGYILLYLACIHRHSIRLYSSRDYWRALGIAREFLNRASRS